MKKIYNQFNLLLDSHKIELLLFFSVFIIVFPMINFNPSSGANSVEQWMNLTNQMFYGSNDFMFSYGPAYWLVGGVSSVFSAKIYLISKLFISFIAAFFWTLLISLTYRHKVFIYFAIAFVIFIQSLQIGSIFYLWSLMLLYYLEFSKDKPIALSRAAIIVLGVTVGSFFYIRFFYGLLPFLIVGSYFFTLFFTNKSKSLFYFIPSIAIGYIFLGLIIFNDYTNIINYFIINNQLSFGNSVDMVLDMRNSFSCFVAIGIAWVSINIYLILERKILLLPVNIAFLIFLKMGFSRADHYFGYFVVPVIILSFFMLYSKIRIGKFLFLIFLISIGYVTAFSTSDGTIKTYYSFYKQRILGDFTVPYFERISNIYAAYKLNDSILKKIGNGTIDVYPYVNEYIFANNLNYKYRPSFQNYMTLTPKLDKMNEKFLTSNEKPQFILWTGGPACWGNPQLCNPFDGFDNKYALNEDPLTSMSILTNYHIIDKFEGKDNMPLMLLEKNINSASKSQSRIKKETMEFSKWYDVPKIENGIIKLIPNFEFTLFGRAKNLFFRGDILYINYRLSNGSIKKYRLNILNSISGVWISPYLTDMKFNGLDVSQIMFETNDSDYFKQFFNAEWSNMQINETITLENSSKEISFANQNDENWVNGISKDGYKFFISSFMSGNIKEGDTFEFEFSGKRKVIALEIHGDFLHVILNQPIDHFKDGYPHGIIKNETEKKH